MRTVVFFFLISSAVYADELTDLLAASSSEYKKELNPILEYLPTENKNIILSFFEKEDWQKALYEWPKNSFTEPNERALYGYLLYKNNLKETGRNLLVSIEDPQKVGSYLIKLWKDLLVQDHGFWQTNKIPDNWAKALDISLANVAHRAWQNIASKPVPEAAKTLDQLMKMKTPPVSLDLMKVTAARFLYGAGYLDAAIRYYSQVPKSSEYWFLAQEEMAWSYLRKGEPQNSLPITQVLTQKHWGHVAGPEAYFLQALAQLKICDYPGIIKTLEDFKIIFRPRLEQLSHLVDKQTTHAVNQLIELEKQGQLNLNHLAEFNRSLPRLVHRDSNVLNLVQSQAHFLNEQKMAEKLFAQSLSSGTATVGYQGQFEAIKNEMQQNVQKANSAILDQVKNLAKIEIEEIKQILAKLQIAEAEVLQQVITAEKKLTLMKKDQVSELKGKLQQETNNSYLKFADNSELWFDEISHKKINLKKACEVIE